MRICKNFCLRHELTDLLPNLVSESKMSKGFFSVVDQLLVVLEIPDDEKVF